MPSRRTKPLSFIAVSAALLLTACGKTTNSPTTPEQQESRSVELDKSERVRVDLRMSVGELNVRAGAAKLLDADFTYNVAEWKPDLRYRATGSVGDLVIEQQGPSSSSGNAKNRWDLRFNEKVPLDFKAHFGAGEAKLELGKLNLRSVDITMGAGTIEVDLRGTPAQDYAVQIRGGVGEATVRLPKDVGISALASGGIGDISVTGLRKDGDHYVNDAYATATRKIRLDVKGGVGSIRLIAD
jgi:hypothetical protein